MGGGAAAMGLRRFIFGVLVVCVSQCVSGVLGLHLPGVSPVEYPPGYSIRFRVNSFTSTKTAIPFDYYSIQLCDQQKKSPRHIVENFGEILWGDRIKPSPYNATMLKNITCKRVCERTFDKPTMKKLEQRVKDGYRGHFIVDGLPVTEIFTKTIKGFRSFMLGYPVGIPASTGKEALQPNAVKTTILNNHLAFTIKYHKPQDLAAQERGFRIVGFHVVAHSFKHDPTTCLANDEKNAGWYPAAGRPVTVEDNNVVWSYSVNWVEDPDMSWASRWDPYLSPAEGDAKIHWFSIINSCLIMLFLTAMVGMVLNRALHKDFNRYNSPDNPDEAQEETGWKLVHGDVFRTPQHPHLLAVYIGTGCQLIAMAITTLCFALVGFLSPANRGGLLTSMLLLYVLLGSYAGYVSARLCKMFQCQSWYNIFLTAIFFPGQVFCVYFVINLMLWGKHAATATPIMTMISLIGLWICVSLPLVFVGAVVGYRRDRITLPCKVNILPRKIPEQKWFLRPGLTTVFAGILPFGAAFIELFFILSSIWLNRFYYVFGFLALVVVILIITCAELTIVMVYFQLCFEDYNWWWRSFFISGSAGIHLFLYSIFYFFSALRIRQFWSTVVYFGWMFVMSYTFGIVTGTIGFLAAFIFVQTIYSSIKVD